MELIINRNWALPVSTTGRIIVAGTDRFFSMERPPTDPLRIPGGIRYKLTLHTPHSTILVATLAAMQRNFPEEMSGITQMPQFNDACIAMRNPILFHPENWTKDGDGCVGAGLGRLEDGSEITQAQKACAQLYQIVIPAIKSEGCWCTVNNVEETPVMVTDIELGT